MSLNTTDALLLRIEPTTDFTGITEHASRRSLAPRRYGKTTLIGALGAELQARGWIVCVSDFSRCRTLEDVGERLYDGWRRGLDRRDTRSLWKKANREFEATLEAGIPGVARATVRGRQTERARSPLAQVHALLALPERLAAASKRRILVVFDEFQDLLTAGEDLDGLDLDREALPARPLANGGVRGRPQPPAHRRRLVEDLLSGMHCSLMGNER